MPNLYFSQVICYQANIRCGKDISLADQVRSTDRTLPLLPSKQYSPIVGINYLLVRVSYISSIYNKTTI